MTPKLLEGKRGVVFGVASNRSIAWAIAQAWHEAGAKLAFTYQGERIKENVEDLVATFGKDTPLYPCDVTRDEDIAGVFAGLQHDFGKLDLLLHSLAFAPKDALEKSSSTPPARLSTSPTTSVPIRWWRSPAARRH